MGAIFSKRLYTVSIGSSQLKGSNMTATVTKVQTKWETKKIQEVTSNAFASVFLAANEVLGKIGGTAHEEFETIVREHRVNHYKQLGVKTPLDLVRIIAESEHNLFGSEVEISGDENKATLKYISCAMWDATQKLGKFTPEQEKLMGEKCSANWTKIASEFGFKYEPKMEKDSYEMTFSK
jgi:hypothetical protein